MLCETFHRTAVCACDNMTLLHRLGSHLAYPQGAPTQISALSARQYAIIKAAVLQVPHGGHSRPVPGRGQGSAQAGEPPAEAHQGTPAAPGALRRAGALLLLVQAYLCGPPLVLYENAEWLCAGVQATADSSRANYPLEHRISAGTQPLPCLGQCKLPSAGVEGNAARLCVAVRLPWHHVHDASVFLSSAAVQIKSSCAVIHWSRGCHAALWCAELLWLFVCMLASQVPLTLHGPQDAQCSGYAICLDHICHQAYLHVCMLAPRPLTKECAHSDPAWRSRSYHDEQPNRILKHVTSVRGMQAGKAVEDQARRTKARKHRPGLKLLDYAKCALTCRQDLVSARCAVGWL